MKTATKIIRNFYRDSVSLMQLSSQLGKLPGMSQASAIMASEANLALLREAELLDGSVEAGPNDLLIALQGASETDAQTAMAGGGSCLRPEAAARWWRPPPRASAQP